MLWSVCARASRPAYLCGTLCDRHRAAGETLQTGAGWAEFAPTDGIIGSDRLIRIASARDPEQAMPIKGAFTGPPGVGINSIDDVQVRTVDPAPVPDSSTTSAPVKVIAPAA